TRQWAATARGGTSASCDQTITVKDTTPPMITCPGPATVECGGDTSPAATGSASASDVCGSATVDHSDTSVAGGNCAVDHIKTVKTGQATGRDKYSHS